MNEDDVKENIPRFIWRGKIDVTQLQTPLWYPSTDTLRKWDYLKKKKSYFSNCDQPKYTYKDID